MMDTGSGKKHEKGKGRGEAVKGQRGQWERKYEKKKSQLTVRK